MSSYPTLFSPLTVKSMTVKNRVFMPPMGTNFADTDGQMPDEHISYYEQRARGGTGLITVENINVDYPMGSNGTTQLRIDHDRYIPALYRLTERLHSYGTMVSIQINHAGASAMEDRIGSQPLSSSSVPTKVGGAAPRPATVEELQQIVTRYGVAARRAVQAGFDAVEVHAGHSYLLSQFLTPFYNHREDEYGGSPENRARLTREVIEEVRKQVGPNFPIVVRLSAEEWVDGGLKLEDVLEIAEHFDHEVDIYNVSSGLNPSLYAQIDNAALPDGWRSYMARAFKEKFGKPTVTTGNIRHPEVAEKILSDGDADFIGIGRGLIAEPFWATKVQHGKLEDLRNCISCNIGCAGHRIGLNRPIRCTVNPDLYFEDAYKRHTVTSPTKVVVIGGGTTGMEAAATAAEVGCDVVIFERRDQLGGLSADISRIPDKARIAEYRDWMVRRVENLENLEVRTGVEPTIADIEALAPDVVVNATGSVPLAPPIQGLRERADVEGSKVRTITSVMDQAADLAAVQGKKVVVVGGGAVGLDVVELFAEHNDVTVVERLPMVGRDLDPISSTWYTHLFAEHDVTVMTETDLVEVKDESFLVSEWGDEKELPFDLGFVCLGMKANATGVAELTQHFAEKDVEVLNIGDSRTARRIIDGTREGRNIVVTLRGMGRLPAVVGA